MNKRQAERVIKIIKADATGAGRLYDHDNKTYCVIGGLLHALRVPNKDLAWRGAPNDDQYALLATRFGLTRYRVMNLISLNDEFHNVSLRRKRLIAEVKRLVDVE